MTHKDYYPKILRNIRDHIVKIIPENSILFRWLCLIGFRIAAKEKHTRRTSMKIDIPAVEHCNLSCTCCTAFGPLAQPQVLNIEGYEQDMKRLSALTGSVLDSLAFTGGEPLLHPHITALFDIARTYFPDTIISCLTNGVLLLNMPAEFWEHCRKNAIRIALSRYPIRLDLDEIKRIAQSYQVSFDYVGGANTPVKAMWKYPLDLQGRQSVKTGFNICNQVNSCIRMKNGMIYPCNTIACIEHFNRFFNVKLEVTEADYIDINKVDTIEEIYDFLIRPKPFCKYCNRKGVVFGIPWKVSRKEITEWTL